MTIPLSQETLHHLLGNRREEITEAHELFEDFHHLDKKVLHVFEHEDPEGSLLDQS